MYYSKLNAYHNNKTSDWLHFFLDGVIETVNESINTSKKITTLREDEMCKIQALGKREATSGVLFLQHLFKNPITSNAKVAEVMHFTRAGSGKLIERFVDLDILKQLDENSKWCKTYIYKNYVSIFSE